MALLFIFSTFNFLKMEFNFFSITAIAYGIFAIATRVLMKLYGEKWNTWELDQAYTVKKPKWVYFVALFSLLFIIYTWYMVWQTDVSYSWVLAVLLSITLIKISQLVFNYDKFREFASSTLPNKEKMARLNIMVIGFALIVIGLGIFLYT